MKPTVNSDSIVVINPPKNPIVIGAISFGASGLLIAFHVIGVNLLMASFGEKATAASNVVATLHSFIISTGVGVLSSASNQLGVALRSSNETQEKNETVEAMIKLGWSGSVTLGFLASVLFLSTKPIMPMILDEETATFVSDFFVPFALSPIACFISQTNGTIVFQAEKNWWFPLVTTAAYRIPAVGLGYFLSKSMGMGVPGIGLGSSIAAWASLLLWKSWFNKEVYSYYNLNAVLNIPSFTTINKKICNEFFYR
ncbi:MAG: hypothetical protein Q8R24_00355 [Legionellaceae bacterium]|nr:hypothetical protein [Legionellaceae bacterium]